MISSILGMGLGGEPHTCSAASQVEAEPPRAARTRSGLRPTDTDTCSEDSAQEACEDSREEIEPRLTGTTAIAADFAAGARGATPFAVIRLDRDQLLGLSLEGILLLY